MTHLERLFELITSTTQIEEHAARMDQFPTIGGLSALKSMIRKQKEKIEVWMEDINEQREDTPKKKKIPKQQAAEIIAATENS